MHISPKINSLAQPEVNAHNNAHCNAFSKAVKPTMLPRSLCHKMAKSLQSERGSMVLWGYAGEDEKLSLAVKIARGEGVVDVEANGSTTS